MFVRPRQAHAQALPRHVPHLRGLHSFTFQLNVSASCGIGGASGGCLGGL